MTEHSDAYIRLLKEMQKQGMAPTPEKAAKALRKVGLRPTEAGWVLRHSFGLDMPTAVHIATIALEDEDG